MKKFQHFIFLNLTAVSLGGLLNFAFAPYEIFPFAIIMPAGLLFLWMNASPKQAFWFGFLFGMGFFGFGVYWVYISMHFFGGVSIPLSILITIAFIVYLALYPASVGYLCTRFFTVNSYTKFAFAFPALWVFGEWIRSLLLTGFPWLFLGYSQTNSPLRSFAPIFSVYGVSLAVTIMSGLLVNTFFYFKQKKYGALYLNLLLFMFIFLIAALLDLVPWTKPNGEKIAVSLVQGNIPQSIKWSPKHLKLSLDRYKKLTEPLWKKSKNKLIIWPEGAIPLTVQDAASYLEVMNRKAEANHSHLILGIPIMGQNGFYNAVVTLGKNKQVYLKRHLVPFGEYTPLENFFSRLLKLMDLPMSDVVSGEKDQGPLELGNIKILPSICYEIAFPELMNTDDQTIGMLLTLTNDAWFGKSAAEAQHLQIAKMRALELKRPVIMMSNDGITAIINPNGTLDAVAPVYQPYVLNGFVQQTIGLTPWMKGGMDPLLLILLSLLANAIRANRKAVRLQEKNIFSHQKIDVSPFAQNSDK